MSKKDIAAIDKSIGKEGINLENEKDKYLGGDNDVIEGFYGSDEEIDFSKLKKKTEKVKSLDLDQGGNKGIFGRISSAFSNFTGNKELTEQDIRPILKQLSDAMVDKNVAKEVADEISLAVMKSLVGVKTQSFTSVD